MIVDVTLTPEGAIIENRNERLRMIAPVGLLQSRMRGRPFARFEAEVVKGQILELGEIRG